MNNPERMEELEDDELIRRIVGGEVDCFEILLNRYQDFVLHIAIRHVPVDRADEVAQDAFVRAYNSLHGYSGSKSFRQWLRRIAVRQCCDFWRERGRRREVPLSQITDEHHQWLDTVLAADSVEAFERAAAQREAGELLDYALDRLPAKDRTAMLLVYFEGMTVAEAAEALGWNSVLAKARVHRARNRMRKIISDLLERQEGSHEKHARRENPKG